MGDLVAVAGGKHFIGPVKTFGITNWTESDFAGLTWVEVDGWETRGDLGDAAEEINTPIINRGRAVKQKGTFDAGSMENAFAWLVTDPGQLAVIAAAGVRSEYAFKNHYGDTPAVKTATVTITIASPGVVSWANHGLADGTKIVLTTTGALPTGLTASTTYYVVNSATSTFQLSATTGGAAINTSASQSGVHTATTQPTPTTDYAVGLVMGAPLGGGGANDILSISASMSVNSNIVTVGALG